ncbi:MAG: helix-hairpin-helix domain-containing protein [Cytophagales bacterium]|nr:helix-hairpin-helix domain-containing protein [Cytophagales bacterium]
MTFRNKEAEISYPKLFTFDPNRATEQELMKLGLPKFLAARIVKYREKGGRFKKPSDFEKIYGLRTADYQRLLPYITITSEDIPPSHQTTEKSHSPTPTHAAGRNTPISLDINTTDSTQLVKVKGVGPVLAMRILKYRNKLGGFVSMAQIHEVYGLDSMVVQNIKNQYFVSNGFSPKPVLINQSDYKTLAGHPYIGGKLAGQLLNYKKQHGNFHQLSDLEKVHALEPTKLGKLAPYLSFSE